MTEAALRFEGVRLALGGRVILQNLDLAIPEGAFIGVLGPNGAGKTTFLRAALGLVRPEAGRISVAAGRAGIGYMPQTRTPLTDLSLSAQDFIGVACGRGHWGLARLSAAQRADVARVIDLVDAQAFAHRPLRTLSGGERQRVLLAQSLLGTPSMLFLDEPLSSLDPHHQAATIHLVRDLQRRLSITVLFTAHELNPLLPVLDQVLYLGNGEAALGSVAEVVNSATLSRLYGAPIDILHVQGRIFVMADGHAMERDTHVHL